MMSAPKMATTSDRRRTSLGARWATQQGVWRATQRLLLLQWALLLLALLILGWLTEPSSLPAGIERSAENQALYHGWVPTPHPLGVLGAGEDRLELLLQALSRTFTGPLLACLAAVLVGGLWGTWAAFTEGRADRALTAAAILVEGMPRIVLFALVTGLLSQMGVGLSILQVTVGFAVFQIPAVATALRNHVRAVVREGYVEGLVSLGFSRRTIVLRDLLARECGPLLRLQYVARVTELVALETAISYALPTMYAGTIGGLLRRLSGKSLSPFGLALVVGVAVYVLTLNAVLRPARVEAKTA